jgi:hypothetical protein
MIAPPYEMNVLQIMPPSFPYHLMKLSPTHFRSPLDYYSLRAFLEEGFNKASLDHVPDTDSLFGYECTGIRNWHMFTCDVTIFSECFYYNSVYTNGFIVEIRHMHGHYNAYEDGIKDLLTLLNVKLEGPSEQISHIRQITPLLRIDDSSRECDIDHMNRLIAIIENDMMYGDMIHGALVYIASYVSEQTKNYLFIDGVGVNAIKSIAKLNSEPDSIIPIISMMIFAEFIKIKGTSDDIIRDVIMPCIPKCKNNISQHLNRETLGTILAICERDINYFKHSIDGISCYYSHLRTIIMGEMGTRDVCAASYAKQILMLM